MLRNAFQLATVPIRNVIREFEECRDIAFQYGIQQARKRFAIVNMSYGIAILEHMKPCLFIDEIEIEIRRLGRRLGGAASI